MPDRKQSSFGLSRLNDNRDRENYYRGRAGIASLRRSESHGEVRKKRGSGRAYQRRGVY